MLSKAGLEGAWGVVADGFLIPGKQTGSITLLDLTKGLESVGPSETRKVRGEAYFEVFGASGKVLRNSKCSDVFSVAKPGKALDRLRRNGRLTFQVSVDKHAWFYHHTEWLDVNGDGLLDIVAARAVEPLAPWHALPRSTLQCPSVSKSLSLSTK